MKHSVTPLQSGWYIELMTGGSTPRILIRDDAGVIQDAIQFEWWEGNHAEKTYNLMVTLSGGACGAVVTSVAA